MDKLEYVLTLAEERNLTRAAAKLFISQPTLTNYINRLEQELGVRLFDRSVQPIAVTEAGTVYIRDMKQIHGEEQALRAKLKMLNKKNRTFSVGIPSIRSEYVLPKALAGFMESFPDVTVNVDTRVEEFLEKELENGSLDVAIGVLSTAYPGIQYECLGEDRIYLLIPRCFSCVAHLKPEEGTLENPYMIEGSGLSGKRLLLPRVGGGQYRSAMLLIEKYGIVSENRINCSNLHTLYQLVGEGVGILFTTPTPFRKTFPELTDKIACCLLQREPLYQRSYIGYRKDSQNMELIQEFIRLVRENGVVGE